MIDTRTRLLLRRRIERRLPQLLPDTTPNWVLWTSGTTPPVSGLTFDQLISTAHRSHS